MKTTKRTIKKLGIIGLAFTALITFSFTTKKDKEKMKIQEQIAAPNFSIKDVNGETIELSKYKGKKVLLSFYRNVGCPICNVRFHEIQEESSYFKSKNLVVISVYESSSENMKKYLEMSENIYSKMIPNPEQNLYEMYNIDQSMNKVMKGMFHDAMKKMKKGKTLFKQKIKQDGNSNRIGADFLIDENGIVQKAHYGKFVGDHLPIEIIKNSIQ
jgi:peroxiredoxin